MEQFVKQDPSQFLAAQFRIQDDSSFAQKTRRMDSVAGVRLTAQNAAAVDAQVRLEIDGDRPANEGAGAAG